LALHENLSHHRRRTQDFLVVEPVTDVAVVRSGEAPRINTPADLTEFLFDFVLVHDALSSVDNNLVQQTRAVGIDRLPLGKERHGSFATLAEADLVALARAEIVVNHQVLAVRGLAAAQRPETVGNANHPAGTRQAWVNAGQRDRADHLSDAHGHQAPEEHTPPGRGRQHYPGNKAAAFPCTRSKSGRPFRSPARWPRADRAPGRPGRP